MADFEEFMLTDRYRVIESLGQGGMGAVYHAIDESLGVEVAVKENKIDDEDYNRQFKREAKILANMRHPNLPRVTDHFTANNSQYLVMDYVEGEDLRARLERQGPISEKEAILTGIAICDALEYLHTQDPPILHRDIKPGNIKVTSNGHVFLVDFGLAKIDQGGGQQTTTGARGLTPGYSPPEQYGSARTDARSDVYALGATLYALLTGVPPEDGLSIAIQQSTLTKITERKPDTSSQLAIVIEKALAVNTEDRYQSAIDFRHALLNASDTISKEVALGEVKIAPPPSSAFRQQVRDEDGITDVVSPPAGQEISSNTSITLNIPGNLNWGAILGGLGVAVVLIVLGILFIPRLLNSESDLTPTDLPEPTEVASVVRDPAEEPTEEVAVEVVEDRGPQVAYVSNRSGDFQIWLMNLDDPENPEQLTDVAGGACQPDWSPDGTQLAFVSPCDTRQPINDRGSLWVLDFANDGSPSPLPQSVPGDNRPRWSPDGTQILFSSLRETTGSRLFVYDVANKSVKKLDQPSTPNAQADWSPDGNFVTFVLSGDIYVMNIKTGDIAKMNAHEKADSQPIWSPSNDKIVYMQSSPPYLQFVTWTGTLPTNPVVESRLITDALFMRDPDFSADGTQLMFSSNSGGDGSTHELYTAFSTGTGVTQLTSSGFVNFQPNWRP